MNAIYLFLLVFAVTLGGALTGMWMRGRLPGHHLDDESKDTIKLGVGLVATMAALVLGLITASAKASFDRFDSAVRYSAMDVLTLDRLLARYGAETAEIRSELQLALRFRVEMIWPETTESGSQLDPLAMGSRAEGLVDRIRGLTPRDDAQRALQSRALDLVEDILKTRWMASASEESSIPPIFLVIVLFWLIVIFACFGLLAPRNGTVVAVFFVCALSVASILFLVVELDTPFSGAIRVSPEPLRYAIGRVNT